MDLGGWQSPDIPNECSPSLDCDSSSQSLSNNRRLGMVRDIFDVDVKIKVLSECQQKSMVVSYQIWGLPLDLQK